MDDIFFERQEGLLCALHCLNALLQGPYFTAIDLAAHAKKLDDEEQLRMAENGTDSPEYLRFISEGSQNMDDSGYFSVQVITSALRVWGLELVPYTSAESRAKEAVKDPTNMTAYICHYRDHWFTVRRLGNQWFNLNSTLKQPLLISNTYLTMFLAQLQNDGYSIFIVFGNLPECKADQILEVTPIVPEKISPLATTTSAIGDGGDDDEELRKALALSLQDDLTVGKTAPTPKTDEFAKALELSLSENTKAITEEDELAAAIQLSLDNKGKLSKQNSNDSDQLQEAIALSLQCDSTISRSRPETITASEGPSNSRNMDPQRDNDSVQTVQLRELRLKYFDKIADKNTVD